MAGVDAHNRVAQAGNVAAHHAEADQSLSKAKSKRIDDSSIAKLVAQENATKNNFPRYPGLERWELVEKMGDGAFSNVYRARDLEGGAGEVAIKVVRKYEMNNMQVRATPGGPNRGSYTPTPFSSHGALSPLSSHSSLSSPVSFTNFRGRSRAISIYIRISSQRFQKLQRCEILFLNCPFFTRRSRPRQISTAGTPSSSPSCRDVQVLLAGDTRTREDKISKQWNKTVTNPAAHSERTY